MVIVKWFWVDFLGFLPPHLWGPSPLPPSPPLFVSLVADIGGVGVPLASLVCLDCGFDLRLLHKRLAKCEQFCYN